MYRHDSLLPIDLIFFAPVECDLPQGIGAERKPRRFDPDMPNGILEISECAGAVDGAQKLVANTFGLHRAGKILHDPPLVYIKLCRKLCEAVG